MTVSSNYSSAYSSYSSSGTASSKQTDRPSFEDLAKELLSSMDTNNSGSIDSAEFSTAAQALASNSNSSSPSSSSSTTDAFNKLDTNSDSNLSTDELMAALKNMKPPEPQQGQDAGMPPSPLPSESTSASSKSESTASEVFATLDTNEDGTISMDELLVSLENSKTDSSIASSTSQTDTSSQKLSDFMLKNILSYYGNNTSSTDMTSLLSVSA